MTPRLDSTKGKSIVLAASVRGLGEQEGKCKTYFHEIHLEIGGLGKASGMLGGLKNADDSSLHSKLICVFVCLFLDRHPSLHAWCLTQAGYVKQSPLRMQLGCDLDENMVTGNTLQLYILVADILPPTSDQFNFLV